MFDFLRALSLRPPLDQWRDDHEMAALSVLNDAVVEVVAMLDPVVAKAGAKDVLIAPQAFVVREVDPVMRAVVEPIVARLVGAAGAELRAIVEHELVYAQALGPSAEATGAFEGWGDVAAAAAPIGIGTAAAFAVPALGWVASAGFLGFFVTVTPVWPVIIGGTAVAGVGWATGLLNTARIKDKAVERLRKRTRAHVVASVLGIGGNHPSVLEQIRATLRSAATQAEEMGR